MGGPWLQQRSGTNCNARNNGTQHPNQQHGEHCPRQVYSQEMPPQRVGLELLQGSTQAVEEAVRHPTFKLSISPFSLHSSEACNGMT